MRRIAEQHGPEAVAFSQSSPSTTAIADSAAFVVRLMNAFGTPNMVSALELCGWGRGFATRYVFGVGSVATGGAGGAMADIAESGCLILWGYNPSFTRITHATATVAGWGSSRGRNWGQSTMESSSKPGGRQTGRMMFSLSGPRTCRP